HPVNHKRAFLRGFPPCGARSHSVIYGRGSQGCACYTEPSKYRWADSESASVLPVAGAAFQVANGDEDDFGRPEAVDDLIWKARDQRAPGAGIVATDRADLGAGLDQRHRLDHCVKELTAETWTPLLVPANSVDQLGRRGVAGANWASHRPRIS